MSVIRALLRKVLPVRVQSAINDLRGRLTFSGDFPSFAAASDHATGYDQSSIAQAALADLQAQRKHLAAACADARVQQLREVLSAIRGDGASGPFRILDVGGGVGAYFYTLREFFPTLSWTVLETPAMVRAAGSLEGPVQFATSIEQLSPRYDVALLSGALQYFPDPYDAVRRHAQHASYLLINRLPLIDRERDRMTLQRVAAASYSASYPAWFFARERFLTELQRLGHIVRQWDVPQDQPFLDGKRILYRGILLRVGLLESAAR